MNTNRVWVIHEIETSRYDERVKFHGVATTKDERDRISNRNPNAVVTEIEADCDLIEYGAENFHEEPSW